MNGSESAWKRAWRWLRWVLLAETCLLLLGVYQRLDRYFEPQTIGAGDLKVSAPFLAGGPEGIHLFQESVQESSVLVTGPWCVRRDALVVWSGKPERVTVVPSEGPVRRYRLPARTLPTDGRSAYRDAPGELWGRPTRITPHPEGVVLSDGAGCYLFRFADERLTPLPDAFDAIGKEGETAIAVTDVRGRVRIVGADGRTVRFTSVTLDLSSSPQADWDWSPRHHLFADRIHAWRYGQARSIALPGLLLDSVQIEEASGTLQFFAHFGGIDGVAVIDPATSRFRGWRQRVFSARPPFVEARPALVQAFRRLQSLAEEKQFP